MPGFSAESTACGICGKGGPRIYNQPDCPGVSGCLKHALDREKAEEVERDLVHRRRIKTVKRITCMLYVFFILLACAVAYLATRR